VTAKGPFIIQAAQSSAPRHLMIPGRTLPRPLWLIIGTVAIYLVTAYLVLPQINKYKARRRPDLADGSRITHTASGLPGDPLDIALVGTEEDVIRALTAAGWYPADPITFRSSVRIAFDTVFRKPDDEAPVSNLYLFGRKEDLAFEKPVGHSPKERHHVRFWRTDKIDDGGLVWVGSATYDVRIELSHTTGQVTHRISPDVDAERELILADLTQAGHLRTSRWIDGFHTELQGLNGGGDKWHTDGRLLVAVLTSSEPAGSQSSRSQEPPH